MLFKVLVPALLLIGVGIITGVSVVVSQRPPPGNPGTTPVTPPSAAAAAASSSSSSSSIDTPAAATPASTPPASSSSGGAGNGSPTSTPAPLPTPLDALLLPTIPTFAPEEKFGFQAKMDWDLDNNHTIQTNAGIQCSWWAREGYWYDPNGKQFGTILRANDNGLVTPRPDGTQFLELMITYTVQLDDGYWAYVKHTGGAIVRQYQNGVVRVVTDSPTYQWLNMIDFVAPGSFNGTEIMTVDHYFPNIQNLPNGLPDVQANIGTTVTGRRGRRI